jgi:predicted nucleic acid-binding protein
VVPVSEETHDRGLDLAERHKLSLYDAMILASAQLAGCSVMLSEDFQHGQRLAGVRVRNPFR